MDGPLKHLLEESSSTLFIVGLALDSDGHILPAPVEREDSIQHHSAAPSMYSYNMSSKALFSTCP